MPDDLKDLGEELALVGQKALAAPPVIILGSGASMAYGVGGMGDLAKHLEDHVIPYAGSETEAWSAFKNELNISHNLEAALQNVLVPDRLLSEVVKATHILVARDDRIVLEQLIKGRTTLALTRLIRHLFQSTHKRIQIVTTNYDRLAEYAANLAGFNYYAGFTSGIYGSSTTSLRLIQQVEPSTYGKFTGQSIGSKIGSGSPWHSWMFLSAPISRHLSSPPVRRSINRH